MKIQCFGSQNHPEMFILVPEGTELSDFSGDEKKLLGLMVPLLRIFDDAPLKKMFSESELLVIKKQLEETGMGVFRNNAIAAMADPAPDDIE